MSTNVHDVVIIGAGLAGLTAAYVLRQNGISAIILEQEPEIGVSWQRRHPQLTLNTHRDLSTLPGARYPKGTGAFPKRDAVVRHLQAFAREHAFDIRHGVTVSSVTREDGGSFRIVSDAGEFHAAHVIMAVGRDTEKQLPAWDGLEHYDGDVRHAADFGNAQDYAGRSVLVVGGGNSGFDVLNHLSRVKTGPVWFSVRRGPSILPKRLLRFAVHRLSPVMQALPTPLVDRMIAATQHLAFGSLSRLGFPKGSHDAATRLVHDKIAIPVDDGAMAAIRSGQITVVRGVRSFERDAVILEDESRLTPDMVIVATGYGTSALAGEPVGSTPGLWHMGLTPSLTSFFRETEREAAKIARSIAATPGRSLYAASDL
ncbi:cation diffusion facilitator CzcD-associated flavoprotein CzcO [Rhizobium sp. PP-CC-3A-592]|nr:cation diffusion facilitator CzcD-associated flavoprotein CzcO [Rhizobium sp. PP-CC-3A-592]